MKLEQSEDLCLQLETARIFNEEDWLRWNRENYHKWKAVASVILRQARIIYCQYSLYQSLCHDEIAIPNHYMSTSNNLRAMLERAGFNVIPTVYAIYRWMAHFAISSIHSSTNTLYVVGEPDSDAETFCNSIVEMMHCVVTTNINKLNVKEIAQSYNQIKMLYFPPITHDIPFKDPIVNTILAGRPISTLVDGDVVKIGQIKCLVRLKTLPPIHSLPTSPNQHIILHFTERGEGIGFKGSELKRYVDRYIRAPNTVSNRLNEDFTCRNPYGAICSLAKVDIPCKICCTFYNDAVNANE
ncbi:ORF12 [Falcon aviadenovirus A]|nr:ORF12 [Falcon aviadenovirus A]